MYAFVIVIIIIIQIKIIVVVIIIIIIKVTITIIIMITMNKFDGFEVNFLTIYEIENVQKIWVENKESCGREKYIYWPFSVHVV